MGATCHVMRITPATLAILEANPDAIELFVCCYRPVAPPGLPAQMREAFLSDPGLLESRQQSIDWLSEDFPELADALIPETDKDHVDLDKSWGQLEEFLQLGPNGSVVGRAVFGGMELGPNLGYAPARFLRAEEVKEIADALPAVAAARLSDVMLRDLFGQLRAFYRTAAANGEAMLQGLA